MTEELHNKIENTSSNIEYVQDYSSNDRDLTANIERNSVLEISSKDIISSERITRWGNEIRCNKFINTVIIDGIELDDFYDEFFEMLSSSIAKNTTIIKFEITAVCIINDVAVELFKALENNQTIRTLILCDNIINREEIKYLADILGTTSIERLDIVHNALGAEGIKYIANSLKNNKTITSLDLSHNMLTLQAVKYLSSMLSTNTILKKLSLSEYEIDLEGLKHLNEEMKSNHTLSALNLYGDYEDYSDDSFTDAELEDNEFMQESEGEYDEYEIDENGDFSIEEEIRISESEKMKFLMSMLHDHTNLNSFVLIEKELNLTHIQIIVEQLKSNSNVKNLTLRHCKIDDDAAMRLADLLLCNKHITKLDLSSNEIDEEGFVALLNALKYNNALVEVNLSNNNFSNIDLLEQVEIIDEIRSMLRENKSLVVFLTGLNMLYKVDDDKDESVELFGCDIAYCPNLIDIGYALGTTGVNKWVIEWILQDFNKQDKTLYSLKFLFNRINAVRYLALQNKEYGCFDDFNKIYEYAKFNIVCNIFEDMCGMNIVENIPDELFEHIKSFIKDPDIKRFLSFADHDKQMIKDVNIVCDYLMLLHKEYQEKQPQNILLYNDGNRRSVISGDSKFENLVKLSSKLFQLKSQNQNHKMHFNNQYMLAKAVYTDNDPYKKFEMLVKFAKSKSIEAVKQLKIFFKDAKKLMPNFDHEKIINTLEDMIATVKDNGLKRKLHSDIYDKKVRKCDIDEVREI